VTDDLKKLRHTSADPGTSHHALREMDKSGKRLSHNEIVRRAVYAHPGLTAVELTKPTGLTEYQVRRRLTDLKNKKTVRPGEEKECSIHKSIMVTWWPRDGEREQPNLPGYETI